MKEIKAKITITNKDTNIVVEGSEDLVYRIASNFTRKNTQAQPEVIRRDKAKKSRTVYRLYKKTSNPKKTHELSLSIKQLKWYIECFLKEYKNSETVGTYQRSLREFERWFVIQKGKFHFVVNDIIDYKNHLVTEKHLKKASVSTYLTAVRKFCDYLVKEGVLQENPAKVIGGNPRPRDHSREVLTKLEIEKLLNSIDTQKIIGKRDIAIIHLMLYAGLSEAEIVRANIEDLKQTAVGWFLHVQGKGRKSKDEKVPLGSLALGKVQIYLFSRENIAPSRPLFVSHGHRSYGKRLTTRSVRNCISNHLEISGVKRANLTPHSLTHTAALIWLNQGLSLKEVNRRMRHKTMETTMIHWHKKGMLYKNPSSTSEE